MGTTIVVLYIVVVVCLQAYLSLEKEREGGIPAYCNPWFICIFSYLYLFRISTNNTHTAEYQLAECVSQFVCFCD